MKQLGCSVVSWCRSRTTTKPSNAFLRMFSNRTRTKPRTHDRADCTAPRRYCAESEQRQFCRGHHTIPTLTRAPGNRRAARRAGTAPQSYDGPGTRLGQVWSNQTCPGMVCAVHQFQIQVMPENPQPSSRFQKNSRVIEIIFRLPRAAQISPQLTRLVMRFGVDDYPFKRPEYNIESAAATIPHAQTIAQTLSRTVLPPEIVAHIAKNYLFEWEWGWGRGALQAVRRSPGRAGGRGRIRSRLLVQIRQRILRRGALATRCAFLDPELGRI
jgi:hypothetical protein